MQSALIIAPLRLNSNNEKDEIMKVPHLISSHLMSQLSLLSHLARNLKGLSDADREIEEGEITLTCPP